MPSSFPSYWFLIRMHLRPCPCSLPHKPQQHCLWGGRRKEWQRVSIAENPLLPSHICVLVKRRAYFFLLIFRFYPDQSHGQCSKNIHLLHSLPFFNFETHKQPTGACLPGAGRYAIVSWFPGWLPVGESREHSMPVQKNGDSGIFPTYHIQWSHLQ